MKIDPHKHKERYLAWRERIKDKIPELSQENSNLVLNYIEDMEKGLNIAKGSIKDARSYPRLNNLNMNIKYCSCSCLILG